MYIYIYIYVYIYMYIYICIYIYIYSSVFRILKRGGPKVISYKLKDLFFLSFF